MGHDERRSKQGGGVVVERTHVEPWRARLTVPTYTVKAAAHLSGAKPGSIAYWLKQREEERALIPERPRHWNLSWLQMVEVAFVATMRSHGVSLQRIRRARSYLADAYRFEYPFAQLRLKTDGAHILMEADTAKDEYLIVADERGQMAWGRILAERYAQFEYEQGIALTWHPRGKEHPVTVDPRYAYGLPAVRGVPTRVLLGRFRAGEKLDELSDDYGLDLGHVIQALAFEGVGMKR